MQWITNLLDTQKIDNLMSIAEKFDWWTEISQAECDSIKRGMQDLSKNKVFSHSEVMKQYEKYL